jgi:predicted Zn finger-like uncharacterized protein
VIVTCERCETEFQLDDTRVPMSGARVRCSRCKHAFFVLPPAATRDQAIEQAASAALADDPAPGVTEDLAADEPYAAEGEGESESDWQFNAELPADPGESSPDLHASGSARAEDRGDPLVESGADEDSGPSLELASDPEPTLQPPARVATPPAAERSEDLGSPVNWDFFDEPGERAPSAPAAPERASAPAATLTIPFEAESEPEPARDVPLAMRRAVDTVGWLAVTALCALALVRGLAPPAPAATVWPAPAPGLALADVHGSWIENAALGRLYVVSGRVENRTSDASTLPPLALELRDAHGRAVGDPIPLRGATPPEQLREADPAGLTAAGSPLPGGLAPGVSWSFSAIAWPLPAEAARFAIRARS